MAAVHPLLKQSDRRGRSRKEGDPKNRSSEGGQGRQRGRCFATTTTVNSWGSVSQRTENGSLDFPPGQVGCLPLTPLLRGPGGPWGSHWSRTAERLCAQAGGRRWLEERPSRKGTPPRRQPGVGSVRVELSTTAVLKSGRPQEGAQGCAVSVCCLAPV